MKLLKVTLVAVSSIKIDETIKALEYSMRDIEYYEVVLISHEKPEGLSSKITFKRCHELKSIEDYSNFLLYDLTQYIKSEYALIVQYDGYVLRPQKWRDCFLNYDYIGSPWPKMMNIGVDGKDIRVGNGGFSLRSKRLLNSFNELKLPFLRRNPDDKVNNNNEDVLICCCYRKLLEDYGIKFAPVEVASLFSREMDCDDSVDNPFGFHNQIYYVTVKLVKCLLNDKLLRVNFHCDNIGDYLSLAWFSYKQGEKGYRYSHFPFWVKPASIIAVDIKRYIRRINRSFPGTSTPVIPLWQRVLNPRYLLYRTVYAILDLPCSMKVTRVSSSPSTLFRLQKSVNSDPLFLTVHGLLANTNPKWESYEKLINECLNQLIKSKKIEFSLILTPRLVRLLKKLQGVDPGSNLNAT